MRGKKKILEHYVSLNKQTKSSIYCSTLSDHYIYQLFLNFSMQQNHEELNHELVQVQIIGASAGVPNLVGLGVEPRH